MPRNTKKTPKKAPRGKPFTKADPRINLTGRPPLTPSQKEFKSLCQEKSPAALGRIEGLSKKGRGMTALVANQYIVDRGYGKPTQETVFSGGLEIHDGRSALAKALGLSDEPGPEAPAPPDAEPGRV